MTEEILEKMMAKLNLLTTKLAGYNPVEFERQKSPSNLQSDELGELFSALAKAQAEIGSASLNKENPYFKSRYSDLQRS